MRAADLAWSTAAGGNDIDAAGGFIAGDGKTSSPNEPRSVDAFAGIG